MGIYAELPKGIWEDYVLVFGYSGPLQLIDKLEKYSYGTSLSSWLFASAIILIAVFTFLSMILFYPIFLVFVNPAIWILTGKSLEERAMAARDKFRARIEQEEKRRSK